MIEYNTDEPCMSYWQQAQFPYYAPEFQRGVGTTDQTALLRQEVEELKKRLEKMEKILRMFGVKPEKDEKCQG